MALPLKVLIQGVPSCKLVASVFIRYPTSSSGWMAVGSKQLFSGFPPSPSQKGDLLVIHIRVPVSHWISPGGWWWVHGGALSSLRATSKQRSSMSCHSTASPRSPRSAWNWCGVLPSRWGSLGDDGGSFPYWGLEAGCLTVLHSWWP